MSEPDLRLSDEGRGRRELAHLGLLLLLLAAYALPYGLHLAGQSATIEKLLDEDGLYEWAGALACLAGGLLFISAWRSSRISGARVRKNAWPLLFGLLLLALAGEELSWGQRLFGFDAPPWFIEHNHQRDLTLHNLDLLGARHNAASDLGVELLQLYLLVLPLALAAFPTLGAFARRVALPVPALAVALFTVIVKFLNSLADQHFGLAPGVFDRLSVGEIFETSLELLLLAVAVDFWFTARRDSKPSDQPQEQVPAGGGGG